MSRTRLLLLPAVLLLTGCTDRGAAPEQTISLETRADTMAMQVYDALGGPEAWRSVPYLRFTFGVGRGEGRRHLWNRQTGAYRLEWQTAPDSQYVALFNVNTHEGQVYLDGAPVDSARNAELLEGAYRSYINDTYWLLAPIKLFDPGVTRAYLPDSSTQRVAVLQLTFSDVGLTPGDRYWLYVDRETGMLNRWAFRLQSMPDSAAPHFFRWTGYESFDTPAGTVRLATRKEALASPATIFTDEIALPTEVSDSLFTAPRGL